MCDHFCDHKKKAFEAFFHFSRGRNIVQYLKNLPRIQDALRIKYLLNAPHQINLSRGIGQVHIGSFGDPYAVFA